MTSHDVRDVLNLPQDGSAPRPSKKAKPSAPRPNLKGLAREVQNLGGDNPIAIVPEISIFKKRRQASRKPAARWEMCAFKNSAREDSGLILRHWRRKTEGNRDGPPPPGDGDDAPMADADGAQPSSSVPTTDQTEDSAFAKFNVQVDIPQYNDDQYNSRLRRDDWTRDETDYLLELARDFDLRWPIIWDRYDYSPRLPEGDATNGNSTAVVPVPKQRSMEDLKARYYEVAAKMMAVQKPAQYMTQPEFSLYETMLNFDPEMETQRKKFAVQALSISKEQAREEESLLLEVKRIIARQERFNEERRDLYSRLDFPASDQDISAFKSSQGLATLLQNLMVADKSKKRKSLMGPDGVSPASAGPNGQPPSAGGEGNRRESIAAASASGHRDSIGAGEMPTPKEGPPTKGNKKGAQQPERRKLTEQEEQVYGVSYHDRLGSGPTFRYERVNKLFSHKSGQQQMRITNALNELDIPSRLTMPTAAVTQQFEQLVQTVTQLVDLRKQLDKLDGEIKIEQARRAEREKSKPQPPAAPAATQPSASSSETHGAADGNGSGGGGSNDKKEKDKDKDAAAPAAAAPQPPDSEAKASADKAAGHKAAVTAEDQPPKTAGGGDKAPSAPATNGDAGAAATEAAAAATTNGTVATTNEDGVATATENGDAGADKDKDKDKEKEKEKERPNTRPSSRPGSSGAHKRSASVLSTTSDKSSKRQKK